MTEEIEKKRTERAIALLQRHSYPNIAEWVEDNHPSIQEEE